MRTAIGEGAAALQCTTDNITCCGTAGEFYYPDGSLVDDISSVVSVKSYYISRSSMLIGLNRRSATVETGQFRCEIPDANGTLVNLFINIGMIVIV